MNDKTKKKLILIIIIVLTIIVILVLKSLSDSYSLDIKEYVTVETFNALVEDTSLQDGDYVKTKGYYEANDGGSAMYKIRNKKNTDGENIDGLKIIELKNGLLAILQTEEKYTYNVKQIGVRTGISLKDNKKKSPNQDDTEKTIDNTERINKLIKNYSDTITLYFPAGYYLIETIDVSGIKNIKFEGVSNNLGSIFNYEQGDIYSVVIFHSNAQKVLDDTKAAATAQNKQYTTIAPVNEQNENYGEAMIKLGTSGTNISINNMGFYGSWYECNNGLRNRTCSLKNNPDRKPVYGAQKTRLIKDNNYGKTIKISNSAIAQWGVAIGNEMITPSGLDKYYNEITFKVNIDKTRFSYNGIAISNISDSTVTNSSLNYNDYAFVFTANTGGTVIDNKCTTNTKITHCRVEWSQVNSYYIKGNANGIPSCITIENNEFDIANHAIIYMTYSPSSINNKPTKIDVIGNVFRRAGASTTDSKMIFDKNNKTEEYKEEFYNYNYNKNLHLYINGCKDCNFKYNYTKVMTSSDSGGELRPYYVSHFKDCEDTTVKYNDFTGAREGEEAAARNSEEYNYVENSNFTPEDFKTNNVLIEK